MLFQKWHTLSKSRYYGPIKISKRREKDFPYFFNTKVSIEIKENNSGGSKFLCLCISVLTVNSRSNPPIDVWARLFDFHVVQSVYLKGYTVQ